MSAQDPVIGVIHIEIYCLLLRINKNSDMNFNLRAFPLTGSDPKRSNQGQKGKTNRKTSILF